MIAAPEQHKQAMRAAESRKVSPPTSHMLGSQGDLVSLAYQHPPFLWSSLGHIGS